MTQAIVRIPAPLRSHTGGVDEVAVAGDTAREALKSLGEQHAGLLEKVLDEHGEIRQFVNLFLGENDLKQLDGLDTRLSEGDVLSIIPAVAGGGSP
jgi:molybdopterin synthase sulfur carrier subunit